MRTDHPVVREDPFLDDDCIENSTAYLRQVSEGENSAPRYNHNEDSRFFSQDPQTLDSLASQLDHLFRESRAHSGPERPMMLDDHFRETHIDKWGLNYLSDADNTPFCIWCLEMNNCEKCSVSIY